MASEGQQIRLNMVAAATLGSAQYKGVVMSATRERGVLLPNTTSVLGQFVGVLQNAPAAVGDAAVVAIAGETKMVTSNTTIAYGQTAHCSTAGWAIPTSTDAQRVGWVVAGTSGTTGRTISVVLQDSHTTG